MKVCSGTTGHVEVYDFEFSGDQKTYEDLVKQFFMFHDPTTLNRQGECCCTISSNHDLIDAPIALIF